MTKDKTVTMSRELAEIVEAYISKQADAFPLISTTRGIRSDSLDQLSRELRALLAAPVVERHPVAWLVQCKSSGLMEQAEPNEKASNPERWTDAFPVYASPPAPVAVLNERYEFEKGYAPEALERDSDEYVRMAVQMAWEGWHQRACLDKVKEVN